jgi:bile acid-coenzyme A ligase
MMSEQGLIPLGEAFRRLSIAAPDATAVTEVPVAGVGTARTVTRRELEACSNRLARTLLAVGVTEGSLVTIGLPNGVSFVETCLAAWKCGATPQPVSHRLPEAERRAIIEVARPSVVITEPLDPTSDDDSPIEPYRVAPSWKAPTSGGSTGRPKVILSTEPALVHPSRRPPFRGSRDGTQLVAGPLYHNAPFVYAFTGLFAGNHLVVMCGFDALGALRLIEQHRVDWIVLVPTMMSRMLKVRDSMDVPPDISSLNGMLHLAAPCPPWVKEAWIHWIGPERVWELYGGTEQQGVTYIRGDDWLAHRGSVGRPEPGTMRILAADGHEVPPGVVGEIWMKPPNRPTYRYLGATPRTADGWESLGDLGSMDRDGYLYISDRREDLIISGGANIYPAEVEAALDEHPDVLSCAVVGLPDEDLGQAVRAIVQVSRSVTEREILAFLAQRLARYKLPRSFEFVTWPVRDDAGKVRRSSFRP